jgi:hypothetical protein
MLVVFGAFIWVGVSIALMNAFNAILNETQIESRIVQLNEGDTQLSSTLDWWNSLTDGDRIKKANRNRLVKNTESIIEAVMVSYTTQDDEESKDSSKDSSTGEQSDDSSKLNLKTLQRKHWADNEPALRMLENGVAHARTLHADTGKNVMTLAIPAQRPFFTSLKFLSNKRIKIGEGIFINERTMKQAAPSLVYNACLKKIFQGQANRGNTKGDKAAKGGDEHEKDRQKDKHNQKDKHALSILMVAGSGIVSDGSCRRDVGMDSSKDYSDKRSAMSTKKVEDRDKYMESRLDQFLSRGLGEALAKTAEDRNVIVLSQDQNNEVTARVTEALKSWQLGPVDFIGVSQVDESQEGLRSESKRALSCRQPRSAKPASTVDLNRLNMFNDCHIFLRQQPSAVQPHNKTEQEEWPVLSNTFGTSMVCESAEALGLIYHTIVAEAAAEHGPGRTKFTEIVAGVDERQAPASANVRDRPGDPAVITRGANQEYGEEMGATSTKGTNGSLHCFEGPEDESTAVYHVLEAKAAAAVEALDSRFMLTPTNRPEGERETSSALASMEGEEPKVMYGLRSGNLDHTSYLMLLIHGDETARLDVLAAVRMEWDILVFKGTGGLADRVADELETRSMMSSGGVGSDEAEPRNYASDTTIDEIVSYGKIYTVDVCTESVEDVSSLVISRIHRTGENTTNDDPVLFQCWQTYAKYRKTALSLKQSHNHMSILIAVMEVLEILLVVLQIEVVDKLDAPPAGLRMAFEILIGIGPVLITVCSIINNHFSWGIKFVIMQGAAENIRSQIFKYRSKTGKYADKNSSARQLASAMARITNDVVRSECQNVPILTLEPARDKHRPPATHSGTRWSRFRYACFELVHGVPGPTNPAWEKADFLLIIGSSVCTLLSFIDLGMPALDWLLNNNLGFNLFFAVAFTIQVVLNLLGFGFKQFWRQYWMRFDTVIVVVGWAGYVADLGSYARFARMLRIARIGKLLAKRGSAMGKGQRAKTLNLYYSDDAVTTIDAAEYITFRLEHVMQGIKKEIVFLNRHYFFFSICVCLMVGIITTFGLIDLGAWVIFAISLSSFFRYMLALTQSESRLQSANETMLQMANMRDWWHGLDSAEHLKQTNVVRLVDTVEQLIEGYIASSLSALKSALEDDDDGGAHEKNDDGESDKKPAHAKRGPESVSGEGASDEEEDTWERVDDPSDRIVGLGRENEGENERGASSTEEREPTLPQQASTRTAAAPTSGVREQKVEARAEEQSQSRRHREAQPVQFQRLQFGLFSDCVGPPAPLLCKQGRGTAFRPS